MLVNPRDSKPISTVADGYEVQAFGNINVLSVSPTYFLKRSWRIRFLLR